MKNKNIFLCIGIIGSIIILIDILFKIIKIIDVNSFRISTIGFIFLTIGILFNRKIKKAELDNKG